MILIEEGLDPIDAFAITIMIGILEAEPMIVQGRQIGIGGEMDRYTVARNGRISFGGDESQDGMALYFRGGTIILEMSFSDITSFNAPIAGASDPADDIVEFIFSHTSTPPESGPSGPSTGNPIEESELVGRWNLVRFEPFIGGPIESGHENWYLYQDDYIIFANDHTFQGTLLTMMLMDPGGDWALVNGVQLDLFAEFMLSELAGQTFAVQIIDDRLHMTLEFFPGIGSTAIFERE
ncbi:MAG: hypothetical protein FWE01_02425 [Firmicutes bacterium]|nr:hypothetical protein [Bacillota bacterium]